MSAIAFPSLAARQSQIMRGARVNGTTGISLSQVLYHLARQPGLSLEHNILMCGVLDITEKHFINRLPVPVCSCFMMRVVSHRLISEPSRVGLAKTRRQPLPIALHLA